MILYRHSTLARLVAVMVLVLVALTACGSGDKRDSESGPTVAPGTITPPPTRTPIIIAGQPSPTPFPTLTSSQPLVAPPSATPLVLQPTAVFTAIPIVPLVQATAYPYDVRITYPVDGSQIAGYITIMGSASHPRFVQYALEWGPDPNPANLWYPFLTPPQRTSTVLNGPLGFWDTRTVPDGNYQIRVHVWLNDSTDTWDLATGLRISNQAPTAIPTLTPTTLPNQLPVINPIPSQQVNAGSTAKIAVSATDPDGDPVNLFVASSNTSVASALVSAAAEVSVTGVTAGTSTITVTASDNRGGTSSTAFIVTVQGQNQAPVIAPIAAQTLQTGQTLDVPLTASDPDGDTLNITATSDNGSVVSASIPAANVVRLTGISAGITNVTVTANDGKGGIVSAGFQVTVGTPNLPPTIALISPQAMDVGQVLDVAYSAVDPDSDPLTAVAASDDASVVAASVTSPGVITLVANGSGNATVTLLVDDGVNAIVSMPFAVSVAATNAPPSIQPIGTQNVAVGADLVVPVSVFDPDSDPVTLAAVTDNPTVASAYAIDTNVVITGVTPGQALVTVDASDNRGGTASTSFSVTVIGINNPPLIDPIAPQSLNVGEEITIPVVITDPDGDPIVLTAISQNPGVATAAAFGTDAVILQGVSQDTATVELTADDARGGVSTATFTVNVAGAPPTFDLMAYPVLPDIPQPMAFTLSQVYQSGLGLGNQSGAFAKVGDDPMDSPNFMAVFADGPFDLGNYGYLQNTLNFYSSTPVRAGDPIINSFNVNSVAAGAGYGIDALSNPAPAGPPCDAVGGGTNLSCELLVTRPSVALISFSAPNVVFMDSSQFRSEVQTLVNISLSQYGVIPVLATIPAGGGYGTEQLADYNRAIVEVATQSGVPLWNLWRAMAERGITDPNGVAPQGAGNLTEAALSYGFNIRNLTALQTLDVVRTAVGIQ